MCVVNNDDAVNKKKLKCWICYKIQGVSKVMYWFWIIVIFYWKMVTEKVKIFDLYISYIPTNVQCGHHP